MNVDKIVPSEEKIEAMEKQEEQAAMMEQQSQLMAEDEALRKLGTVPQSNSTQLAPGPTAVNVPAAPSPQG